MEEITLTGGTLMASADAPANLSGGPTAGGAGNTAGLRAGGGTTGGSGSDAHHPSCPNHSHGHHDHSAATATAAELELSAPSPSLDELVRAPKEEICRALSTLFRFGRFEALEPLLEKLQQANESVSAVFELLKDLDDGGHSLLHWAAKRVDDIRFLQLVIDIIVVQFHDKEFLNVASKDNVGMRPLHWACTEGSIPHLALLLKHGADMEAKDSSGCTPLLIAAQYGQVETVAYLLQKGANGQAVDSAWDTALHWAAYKGSIQVCGLLSFYQELDWSTVDAYGQTPLHLASLRGHTSVVRYILLHLGSTKQRSDLLFLKDKNERTPLDLAIHKNRPTVEAVLKEAMAADKDPRGHFFRQTLWTTLREATTLRAWKSWMGLTMGMDEVDEPMKGPYYFMIFNFILAAGFVFGLFCPLLSVSTGLLWDRSGLLFWNVTLAVASWYCFYKTVKTSPGFMDDSMKNIATWRKMYEETLEAYGAEDANAAKLSAQTVRVRVLNHKLLHVIFVFSALSVSRITLSYSCSPGVRCCQLAEFLATYSRSSLLPPLLFVYAIHRGYLPSTPDVVLFPRLLCGEISHFAIHAM